MAKEIIPHEIKDWSPIPLTESIWDEVDISNPLNFGIHRYDDRLWTSGYVGVGRLYNKNQKPILSSGKEHIIVVSSRYNLDPWKMLETVMADEEYEDYLSELDEGKNLFKVFYDQPLIRLAQDRKNEGDVLYALSFINSCYSLCKKGLKKNLIRKEENYRSKIRGKINVKNNIRENTSRGRNDRFFCQYIDFTEDTVENRIIKSTLQKCKTILTTRFELSSEMLQRISYCKNIFRRVKNVSIKNSDFNAVSVSGLYMYYKPLIQQARCIHNQKYYSYTAENGETIIRSVYTVPYMINMEALFEFYARAVLKQRIDSKYYLDSYSKRIYLQRGVTRPEEAERGIHLMTYCIPDILICNKDTNEPMLVLDAKYKGNARTERADSHQLLSYVLLTGAKRCGFIFPGSTTQMKPIGQEAGYLNLSPADLRYYELILGNDQNSGEIEKLLL